MTIEKVMKEIPEIFEIKFTNGDVWRNLAFVGNSEKVVMVTLRDLYTQD
jgi:hypothetical protein